MRTTKLLYALAEASTVAANLAERESNNPGLDLLPRQTTRNPACGYYVNGDANSPLGCPGTTSWCYWDYLSRGGCADLLTTQIYDYCEASAAVVGSCGSNTLCCTSSAYPSCSTYYLLDNSNDPITATAFGCGAKSLRLLGWPVPTFTGTGPLVTVQAYLTDAMPPQAVLAPPRTSTPSLPASATTPSSILITSTPSSSQSLTSISPTTTSVPFTTSSTSKTIMQSISTYPISSSTTSPVTAPSVTTQMNKESGGNSSSTSTIIGSVVGVATVIGIAVAATIRILKYRRDARDRRRNNRINGQDQDEHVGMNDLGAQDASSGYRSYPGT